MTTWSFVPPSLRRSCKGHARPEPLFSARSLESMAIGAGGDQAAEAVSAAKSMGWVLSLQGPAGRFSYALEAVKPRGSPENRQITGGFAPAELLEALIYKAL